MPAFDTPVVIGSGPSGTACVAALLARGIKPVVIDGGLEAGSDALERHRNPERYRDGYGTGGSRSDPGQKTWFGSDHATRPHPNARISYGDGVVARASYGVGGLSRIWGGTFAFTHDFATWPDDARPAEMDLDLVTRLVPVARTGAAGNSELTQADASIPGSRASLRAMQTLIETGSREWKVELSTVAIDSSRWSAAACARVASCLDGCPADSIWWSGEQIQKWVADHSVRYLTGKVVETLRERRDRVEVTLAGPRGYEQITAPRVYVGAGAIGSAALLVQSGLFRELTLKDTATAFAGLIDLHRPTPGVQAAHHSLSQWWVGSADGQFLAQMYPPEAANGRRIASHLPRGIGSSKLMDKFAMRLHPVIAYLGTDMSDRLRIHSLDGAANVTALCCAEMRPAFRVYLSELARDLRRTGYLLPLPAVEYTAPGTGYHFGASVPHGETTDGLGRPRGLSRIHIIDSSVLPSLATGSITPTVMANAARIARESVESES